MCPRLFILPTYRINWQLASFRRRDNKLQRERVLRYFDHQLPISLEEALPRRSFWIFRVVQAPAFRKSQGSSLICSHRSTASMECLGVLAVALYQIRNSEVWSPHQQK